MPTDDQELLRWVYGDEISNEAYKPMLEASWYPKLSQDMSVPQQRSSKVRRTYSASASGCWLTCDACVSRPRAAGSLALSWPSARRVRRGGAC